MFKQRFKIAIVSLVLCSAAFSGTAAAAAIVYSGYDVGSTSLAGSPNATNASAAFDLATDPLSTIDFESGIPAGVIVSGGHIGDASTECSTPDLHCYATSPINVYRNNGATFEFASPIDSFGAYFTGWQLDGQTITIGYLNGGTEVLNMPAGDGAGGTLFFGLTNVGNSITSITYLAGSPGTDAVGIDDVRYGTAFSNVAPTCDIQLSQAIYNDGDTVTADIFRIANPSATAVAVEWKVWLGVPGIPPIPIINLGSDGTFVLPAGADVDLGPLPLFPLTAALPSGTYELSCRLLDPVTGGLLSEDLNNFIIRDENLVTNPGFESGATGWVFSDGNPGDGRDVGTCASPCTIPHTGSWAGYKNVFDGGSGTISQSIPTSIGTDYLVELWLADNNVEIGTVTASFGGTLGVSVTGADTSTTHSMYSFTHTATSALTDFVFGGVVTSGTFFIDDVSIVAVQ